MPRGEIICEGCGQYESECRCGMENEELLLKKIITAIFKKLGQQCPHVFTSDHTTYRKNCYFCLAEVEKEAEAQVSKVLNAGYPKVDHHLEEELRVGNILTAKLTDRCRELELQLSRKVDTSKIRALSDEIMELKYNCTPTRNSTHYCLVKSVSQATADQIKKDLEVE